MIRLPLEEVGIYRRIIESGAALPVSRNEKKDTIEYLALMNAKIEFLWRALPHADTEYLAWIDAGTAKHFRDASSWARLASIRFGGFSTILMPGCHHHAFPWEVLCDRVYWMFLGTLFVCHHAFVRTFYLVSVETLERFLHTNRITWEVNIWIDVATRYPRVIRWYEADHDDRMTLVPPAFTRPPVCLVTTGDTTSRLYDTIVRPGAPLPDDGWVAICVASDASTRLRPETELTGDGLRDKDEATAFRPDLVIDERVDLVALPMDHTTREKITSFPIIPRMPLLPVIRKTSCDGLGSVLKCLLNGLSIASECRIRLGCYDTVLDPVHVFDETLSGSHQIEDMYTCRLLMLRKESVLFDGLPPLPHFHRRDGVQNTRLNRFFVTDRRIDFCYEPDKIPLPIRERVLGAVRRVAFHGTVLTAVERLCGSFTSFGDGVLGVSVRTWSASYDLIVYEKAIERAVRSYGITLLVLSIDNPACNLLAPYLELAARFGVQCLVLEADARLNDLQHAAVKMLVLSRCRFFIGNYMSTFTELVYWFSGCRIGIFPIVYFTEVYVLYHDEPTRRAAEALDRAWVVPLECPFSDGTIAVATRLPTRHTRWVGFLSSEASDKIDLGRIDEALRRIEVEEGFAAEVDVVAFFNPAPQMTLAEQLRPELAALFRHVLTGCGESEDAFESPSTVCFYCNYWIAKKEWVDRLRIWLKGVLRFMDEDETIRDRTDGERYELRERLTPYFFGSRGARVQMM